MKSSLILSVVIVVLALPSMAAADWILVPGDFLTIGEAIEAAENGDTVLVSPGTYVENLSFGGKAIAVVSEAGPAVTTIDGAGDGSVVSFVDGEGEDSVLEGFTITGGSGTCVDLGGGERTAFGGGIYCEGSGPSIAGNVITGNATSCPGAGGSPNVGSGGGIAVLEGPPVKIQDNVIESNTATRGGGIFVEDNNARIRRNEITGNTTVGDGNERLGGGICTIGLMDSRKLQITRNRITGGIYSSSLFWAEISENEVAYNTAGGRGGGIYIRMFDDDMTFFSLAIERCVVHHNDAGGIGGGIFVRGLSQVPKDWGGPLINSSRVHDNTSGEGGAGISVLSNVASIYSCLLYDNEAGIGAGGMSSSGQSISVGGNTIVDNVGDGLIKAGFGLFESNIIRGNTGEQVVGTGSGLRNNIEGEDPEPLFVDREARDYRLRLGSPCIDQGAPGVGPGPDIDGDPRFLDGDGDGIAAADIGADEVVAEHAVLYGTVNAASGSVENVLLLNASAGDHSRSVEVDSAGPILLEMLLPSAGGPGKYVIHANAGAPDVASFAVLPASIGTVAFPLLLSDGASPIAIFNGRLGKTQHVGASTYFDGTPIPDPARAPAVLLDLPAGDAANLPPGTDVTFQGVVLDAGSLSPKRASATNGVLMLVR